MLREVIMIREELWQWWTSVRFAIDCSALATQNNAKGRKCLCRFPKSVIRWEVEQMQVEYTAAAMLRGEEKLMK